MELPPRSVTRVVGADGQQRAKTLLLFRSPPLQIDFRDRAAQQQLLGARFAGMGW